ncbi:GIY-YIG nuclease family protein [Flavobacterium sp. DSP2-3-1]|uniref:GIY-YIG nuclease family protein n=1 Tax=Flavobacterium sp. DSP2-3-1 TaxID=2804620 RepID=UPI003CECEEE8
MTHTRIKLFTSLDKKIELMYYYVYVLLSEKDNQFYTGYTSDLKYRLNEYQSSKVQSTKYRLPIKLIYFEECLNQQDAT